MAQTRRAYLMATVFIQVHSERIVTNIINWCDRQGLESYVAPKLESTERRVTDHVGISNVNDEQIAALQSWFKNSGIKAEIEVEDS
jgi:hypothetical protein